MRAPVSASRLLLPRRTAPMRSNDYHFITRWRMQASIEEVSDVVGDAEGLVRWWPSVYLGVKVLEPGDERGIGKMVRLDTKGWLPYTLRWSCRVVDSNAPHGYTIEADGDFVGRGIRRRRPFDPSVARRFLPSTGAA